MIKIIAFVVIFFSSMSLGRCQDSTKVNISHSAVAIGLGFPSGLNLSIHEKILDRLFLSLLVGSLTDRYTLGLGCGIRVGEENSSSNLGFRYTILSYSHSIWKVVDYSTLSFFFQSFNIDASRSPFFWGVGAVFYFRSEYSLFPFAEIGVRLFSF